MYVGKQIWNRSCWVKNPDTGRRTRCERPKEEWIESHHPELQIIDTATFEAAQKKLGSNQVKKPRGRPARHLLSGLLRCEECSGPLVVINRYDCGCATAKDRGTCQNRQRVNRVDAEKALLRGIKEELLGEEAFASFQKAIREELLKLQPKVDEIRTQLGAAQRQVSNIMIAIRDFGIITSTTREELEAAEANVIRFKAELAAAATPPTLSMYKVREIWNRLITRLEEKRMPELRIALEELIGDRVIVRYENGDPVAEIAASHFN